MCDVRMDALVVVVDSCHTSYNLQYAIRYFRRYTMRYTLYYRKCSRKPYINSSAGGAHARKYKTPRST